MWFASKNINIKEFAELNAKKHIPGGRSQSDLRFLNINAKLTNVYWELFYENLFQKRRQRIKCKVGTTS